MIDFIGWTGVVIYLVAYALLGLGWLKADRIPYHALNAIGGICLVIFSHHLADQPNLVVNFVWILLALASMGRIVIIRKNEKPSSKSEQ